jgi:hypothetical protein
MTRADRPTLPPFSPPFVKRPSPTVPASSAAASASPPTAPSTPAWLADAPNEPPPAEPASEVGVTWVNPDEPAVTAPPQEATGIEWLDSPVPASAAPTAAPSPDVDDVFGWDPAEEQAGNLNTAPSGASLDALKEMEPWALPGGTPSATNGDEVAAALERVAARIRSGELFVPGAAMAPSDEGVLAAVLAALLQRARG